MNVEASRRPRKRGKPDQFKQLFNDGRVGEQQKIKCDFGQVVQVRGVLFRLTPSSYQEGVLIPRIPATPDEFCTAVVNPWLERHPVLTKAEVRDLGDDLDVVLWLDNPVELSGDRDRKAWADLFRVVQSTLPINPTHASITATTRAFGSVNSLTDSEVTRLKRGEPVTRDELVSFYREVCDGPFRAVLQIITGQTQLEPCPVCKTKGSSLVAKDDHGVCAGNCGEVSLARFYDVIFEPQHA